MSQNRGDYYDRTSDKDQWNEFASTDERKNKRKRRTDAVVITAEEIEDYKSALSKRYEVRPDQIGHSFKLLPKNHISYLTCMRLEFTVNYDINKKRIAAELLINIPKDVRLQFQSMNDNPVIIEEEAPTPYTLL